MRLWEIENLQLGTQEVEHDDEAAVWEWQEGKRWHQYDPAAATQIESAYNASRLTITLTAGYWFSKHPGYKVDTARKQQVLQLSNVSRAPVRLGQEAKLTISNAQVNTVSGITRKIRRWMNASKADSAEAENMTEGVAEALGDTTMELSGGDGVVRSFAFAGDGEHIAIGYRHCTGLWQLSSGQQLCRVGGHGTGEINSIAFSPSGLLLVTGGEDHMACVWEHRSGQLTAGGWDKRARRLTGHTLQASALRNLTRPFVSSCALCDVW